MDSGGLTTAAVSSQMAIFPSPRTSAGSWVNSATVRGVDGKQGFEVERAVPSDIETASEIHLYGATGHGFGRGGLHQARCFCSPTSFTGLPADPDRI